MVVPAPATQARSGPFLKWWQGPALRGLSGRVAAAAPRGACVGPGSGNKGLSLWTSMLCPAESEGKIQMSYFKS